MLKSFSMVRYPNLFNYWIQIINMPMITFVRFNMMFYPALYTQFLQHVVLTLDTSGNVLVLHHESGKCIYLDLEAFSTRDTAKHHLQFLD